MLITISLATGIILGNVFFHLLPETDNYFLVLIGFLSFFVLEKFLRWHHCHEPDHHHHLTAMSLVGGSIHSLIDGAMITTGLGALLGVVLHEIPQKITYYSIFIHQKNSPSRSLFLSLSTSAPAVLSAIIFLFLNSQFDSLNYYLTPFTAGSFLYLAASDLIPELHRHHQSFVNSAVQFSFVLIGVLLMALSLYFE